MHGQTSDNTPKHAKECAEGLKGKSLAAAERDSVVRVSAELEQDMIFLFELYFFHWQTSHQS